MTLLVDTHAFLWFVAGDERLSATARQAIEEDEEAWCLSVVSVWEMAIKASLRRLDVGSGVEEYVAERVGRGLRLLPIEWTHSAGVERLPFHHRDPFDRLLIVQAQAERLAIVTADPVFVRYGVRVVW